MALPGLRSLSHAPLRASCFLRPGRVAESVPRALSHYPVDDKVFGLSDDHR
jgi:hypothetical protein